MLYVRNATQIVPDSECHVRRAGDGYKVKIHREDGEDLKEVYVSESRVESYADWFVELGDCRTEAHDADGELNRAAYLAATAGEMNQDSRGKRILRFNRLVMELAELAEQIASEHARKCCCPSCLYLTELDMVRPGVRAYFWRAVETMASRLYGIGEIVRLNFIEHRSLTNATTERAENRPHLRFVDPSAGASPPPAESPKSFNRVKATMNGKPALNGAH